MELFGKEIKYFEKYENNSGFKFLEANTDWIVYRSEVSSHTSIKHPTIIPTIDIIFVGAMYFELLSHFNKISITKPKDAKSFELAKKFDKGFEFLESDERVYKIESQNNSFYVVAAHLWIHEHNCQIRESFIDKYNHNEYLKEFVRDWIKIR